MWRKSKRSIKVTLEILIPPNAILRISSELIIRLSLEKIIEVVVILIARHSAIHINGKRWLIWETQLSLQLILLSLKYLFGLLEFLFDVWNYLCLFFILILRNRWLFPTFRNSLGFWQKWEFVVSYLSLTQNWYLIALSRNWILQRRYLGTLIRLRNTHTNTWWPIARINLKPRLLPGLNPIISSIPTWIKEQTLKRLRRAPANIIYVRLLFPESHFNI